MLPSVVVVATLLSFATCSSVGRANIPPERFAIIGGNTAENNELNWMISIQYPDIFGIMKHRCGGSIISKRLILTAAHCFFEEHGRATKINETLIRIVGGTTDLRVAKNSPITIDYILIHEKYDNVDPKLYRQNDIAILRLTLPILIKAPKVGLICLPSASPAADADPEVASVAGWGLIRREGSDTFESPNLLQKTILNIIPTEICRSMYQGDNLKISKDVICTNSTNRDVCLGDSGGALFQTIRKSLPSGEVETKHRIIGIVSASSKGCAKTGKAAVFTRVSSYMRSFILRALKPLEPAC